MKKIMFILNMIVASIFLCTLIITIIDAFVGDSNGLVAIISLSMLLFCIGNLCAIVSDEYID